MIKTIDPKQKKTIDDMFREYFKSKKVGEEYKSREIKKFLHDEYGANEGSIIPSDHCYNSSNKGIENLPNRPVKLFIRKSSMRPGKNSTYIYVGENFDETKVNPYEYGTIRASK